MTKGRAKYLVFLISNFRRALNVVCFLLGNSPASEVYMPTFRNILSVPSSQAGVECFYTRLPVCKDGTECSETSAYKFQTPGNYPKESIQYLVFDRPPWPCRYSDLIRVRVFGVRTMVGTRRFIPVPF
jgi:hypothetical protein